MPKMSKIGPIWAWREQALPGWHFRKISILPFFGPFSRQEVRGVAQNNSSWKLSRPSLQRSKPSAIIFPSSWKTWIFLLKVGSFFVISALIRCVLCLAASAYENHLSSCMPLLASCFLHLHTYILFITLQFVVTFWSFYFGFQTRWFPFIQENCCSSTNYLQRRARSPNFDFKNPEWPRLLVLSKGTRELFGCRQPSSSFMTKRWPNGCILPLPYKLMPYGKVQGNSPHNGW